MLQPDGDESSESSDEDYVPQDIEVSEEEESGEDENFAVNDDGSVGSGNKKLGTRKRKLKAVAGLAKRKKGGICLEGEEKVDEENDEAEDEDHNLAAEMVQEQKEKKEEKEKKHVDDLWASFMSDVGGSTKAKPKPTDDSALSIGSVKKKSIPSVTKSTSSTPVIKAQEKVTVTKVFDFAGESVTVTKEVDAGSKEAKAAVQAKEESSTAGGSSSSTSSTSTTPAVKRVGSGLGSVLGMIGKKDKISTLEKSKLDWNKFKRSENIEEELATHNRGKDGYIERKNFLERSDHRQFEIEKNIRQSNSKR